MELVPEAIERILEVEKDTELTARLLGALGLYNAEYDVYTTKPHPEDNRWV